MYFHSPPILRMSCSWCMPKITLPAPKNKRALKKAWVIKWKMAIGYAETPRAIVMKPNCDKVEYATTRLMSVYTMPKKPMNKAVMEPITKIKLRATSDSSNKGDMRLTIKIPAVTMVAA